MPVVSSLRGSNASGDKTPRPYHPCETGTRRYRSSSSETGSAPGSAIVQIGQKTLGDSLDAEQPTRQRLAQHETAVLEKTMLDAPIRGNANRLETGPFLSFKD